MSCSEWNSAVLKDFIGKSYAGYWGMGSFAIQYTLKYCPFCGSKLDKENGCTGN